VTDQKLLTVTQAAAYLGMTRQTIANAAKRGEIGAKREALGTRDGWIYVFTEDELDAWNSRPRHPGGRPKGNAGTLGAACPA
jgi:excisionase family DNA binding protein